MLRTQRPEDKQQLVVRMRGNLQTPQMGTACVRQPGQHSAHVSALKRLTRGPEERRCVALPALPALMVAHAIDAEQPLHAKLARPQCRAKRQVRRAHQHRHLQRR